MKALEKDRSRRYESASALAADIQRYLSDEPVLACPPTTMYRFQKFARKHKPALATAAAIAALPASRHQSSAPGRPCEPRQPRPRPPPTNRAKANEPRGEEQKALALAAGRSRAAQTGRKEL